nr:efflux RND transporter permease subunit [Lachnospiraceae bacterium]
YINVNAVPKDGVNTTVASRSLQREIDKYDTPDGVNIVIAGETESTNEIVKNMLLMILLGFIFIYLVMVAQFQSLLSPFIVIFTVPLAFTGGLISLLISGQQLSLLSMMGFLILMGVIVNNGIVYVDFVNQLRLGGMERVQALVEAGRKRMRPILMTALTTILAMCVMIVSNDMGSDMGKGMAIVVVGGLVYATLMTLIVVPVLYDIMFKREVKVIDVGDV